jgi:hypothetical protein
MARMPLLKRLLGFVLSGAILGNIVATLIVPGTLAWYNTAADSAAMCNCILTVKETAQSLVKGQLIGTITGAALFLVLGILLNRGRAQAPPVAGPPAPVA